MYGRILSCLATDKIQKTLPACLLELQVLRSSNLFLHCGDASTRLLTQAIELLNDIASGEGVNYDRICTDSYLKGIIDRAAYSCFFQEDFEDETGNAKKIWLFGSDAAQSILVQMHHDAFKAGKPVYMDDVTHLQGFRFLLRSHQLARLKELAEVAVEQLDDSEEGREGDESAASAAVEGAVVGGAVEGGSSGSAPPPAKRARKAAQPFKKIVRKPKAPGAGAEDELSALLM